MLNDGEAKPLTALSAHSKNRQEAQRNTYTTKEFPNLDRNLYAKGTRAGSSTVTGTQTAANHCPDVPEATALHFK